MNYKTKEEHVEYYRRIAKDEWFNKHEIIVSEYRSESSGSPITVVDFRRMDTNVYAIRYIFAGRYVYASGDLGCAVFACTWNTNPMDEHWKSTWYVFEKLSASDGCKWGFDSDVCKSTLRQMLLEQDEVGEYTVYPDNWTQDQHNLYRLLLLAAEDAQSEDHWSFAVQEAEMEAGKSVSILDEDYWEWIGGAGRVMDARIVGIITGLQIIQEKLKKQ